MPTLRMKATDTHEDVLKNCSTGELTKRNKA